MSISIFNSALGRTLRRYPLSQDLSACLDHAIFCRAVSSTAPPRLDSPCHHRKKTIINHRGLKRNYSESSTTDVILDEKCTASESHGGDNPGEATQLVVYEEYRNWTRWLERTMPPIKSRYFFTSSLKLLPLLHKIGYCLDIPDSVPGKVDLSYVNPLAKNVKGFIPKPNDQPQRRRKARINLREITTMWIYQLQQDGKLESAFSPGHEMTDLSGTLSKVFTPEVEMYLHSKKCTQEDVIIWAWILTAKDANIAMSRLQEALDLKSAVPPFLVSFVLRRKPSRKDLESIFPIIEFLLSTENPLRIQDATTTVTLLIRLLRCVREVWPAAMERVANLFISYLGGSSGATEPLPSWITHVYNRFISLLSLPTNNAPYRFISTMQKSQFALVEKLASMDGRITREGYRGLISVQLAHAKLPSEKQKVRDMQTNWPPWQTYRDGWATAHRTAEPEAVSRAGHILQQMKEAGFEPNPWEKSALVLAGKDTDDTPTIQTRQFHPKRRPLWAGRIAATRTINEAWWNFLEYKKELKDELPSRSVYHAMFEKIIADNKLKKRLKQQAHAEWIVKQWGSMKSSTRRRLWLEAIADQQKRNVPGDGIEVVPPPLNPKEGIYNAVPPPSMEEFFEMMQRDGLGLRPLKRLASLLIKEAPNLDFASIVLMQWNSEQASELLAMCLYSDEIDHTLATYSDWPVLTAFLSYLCKSHSVDRALRLLRHYQPSYPPAWAAVASELAWAPALAFKSPEECSWRLRTVWELYGEMIKVTECDDESLRILASAVEKWNTMDVLEDEYMDQRSMTNKVIRTFWKNWAIKEISSDITNPKASAHPPLWPREPSIHALIRALGTAGRYDEIEEVIIFLDKLKFNLSGHSGARVLVAAKVFLEGASYISYNPHNPERVAVLERLDPIVRARWGGWGSPDPNMAELMFRNYITMGGLNIEQAE